MYIIYNRNFQYVFSQPWGSALWLRHSSNAGKFCIRSARERAEPAGRPLSWATGTSPPRVQVEGLALSKSLAVPHLSPRACYLSCLASVPQCRGGVGTGFSCTPVRAGFLNSPTRSANAAWQQGELKHSFTRELHPESCWLPWGGGMRSR